MPEDLIMRGQTVSGGQETLNFGGRTPGYGYQITELSIYPSLSLGTSNVELFASVTANDIGMDPLNVNFDSPGLIATSNYSTTYTGAYSSDRATVINDLFIITQDLILMTTDTEGGDPINWQCRFRKVKLSSSAEAVANFNQFTIYDG